MRFRVRSSVSGVQAFETLGHAWSGNRVKTERLASMLDLKAPFDPDTPVGAFGSMGRQPKQFGWVHEMACPSENEIYTAEILNWRVQKLILHPSK